MCVVLQYLNSLHPAVQFNQIHVQHIVKLLQQPVANSAYVKLCNYQGQRNSYNLVRTIQTTDEAISKAIAKALQGTQPQYMYCYDCYNSNGEFEGKIYSLNPELF